MEKKFDESWDEEDEELDKILKLVGEKLIEEEKGEHIVDHEKVETLENLYQKMLSLTTGDRINVDYEFGEISVTMGSVSISGSKIVINDPASFVEAAMTASNYEIYPKTDGTAQIDFTVLGLTKKIRR